MERYSDRAIAILNELHKERLDYESEYISLIDAANQLAAYEDTGREPEDIETILAVYEQDHKELRKYQDAERDGRLDVRPCSIGDTMYGIRNHRGVNKIQVGIVSDMHYTKNIDGEMRLVIVIKHVCRGLYGDKVFSTYAEAKAALVEMDGEKEGV